MISKGLRHLRPAFGFCRLESFNAEFLRQQAETLSLSEAQLQEGQQDKIKFIVETLLQMTQDEKLYFRHLMTQDAETAYGVDLLALRSDLPLFRERHEAPLPFLNA